MTTDLFTAALDGEQETLEAHKAQNPDVNWDSIKDADGNTLIAAAASRGKLHIIEYLTEQGASLNVPNNDGRTDLQIAYEDGHPNTARGLIALYKAAGIAVTLDDVALQALAA